MAAKEKFSNSLSNGALMRVTPLAIWAMDIEDLETHREVIDAECSLTHSNPLA